MNDIGNNDNIYPNGYNYLLPDYPNNNQFICGLNGYTSNDEAYKILNLKYQQGCMKVDLDLRKEAGKSQMHIVEAAALSQIRLQEEENKAQKREERNEKRKQQFEEIVVDREGNLRLALSGPISSKLLNIVSNIRFPRIIHLQNMTNHREDNYYMFYCQVNDKKVQIYLDCRKLTKGNYLLGKLCGAGIIWRIKTMTKATILFAEFITSLANESVESVLLPEDIGWQVLDSGEFKYVEEGEPTWKKIIEWAK